MTGFTVQETIISGLYLWETRRILKPGRVFQREKTRHMIVHLIWVNVFIIFLDACLLATEYANLFTIQTVFKAAIYSVKLRLEFVVLNQLKKYVRGGVSDTADFSGPTLAHPPAGIALDGQSTAAHRDTVSTIAPNYTVSASKGSDRGVDVEDGVLRTTEVHVDRGEGWSPSFTWQEQEQEQDGVNTSINNKKCTDTEDSNESAIATFGIQKTKESPSSSQINFASKGG